MGENGAEGEDLPARERSKPPDMKNDVHVMTFYDELLCEIAQWMQSHFPEGDKLVADAKQLQEELSSGRHDVPVSGIQAMVQALPAFRAAYPARRNETMHLQKYLESVLKSCDATSPG